MTTSQVLPSHLPESHALQLAVAGYLARFKGISRTHAESDLRAYLGWCADRGLDPLAAARPHVELYVRWMQVVRRLKPSTVSRRTSIVAGFYRTAVMGGLLERSPAEHVRRPHVPADSPTLGLTHLQLEALLTTARQSPNPCDFALVCLLGLLGLRIFEATGLNISDLGEEHGHRVLRVAGKGGKTVLIPLPPAVGRALDRAIGVRASGPILLNRRGARWTGTPPPAASVLSPRRPVCGCRRSTRTCSATPTSPCSTPALTSATSKSPPATPTPNHHALRPSPQPPRPPPHYILAAYLASGT
jgi:integrase